jgi:threonyl-tRNA synthetase
MIKITFPDGNVREFEPGISAFEIAKSISPKLAEQVLIAKINGLLQDIATPINQDSSIQLLKWKNAGDELDKEAKSTFWHSSAHLMAEAIQHFYPDAKFAIGPPIDFGFYYDIDLGDKKLSDDELASIEKKMLELASKNSTFIRTQQSKADAIAYFTQKNDPYKLELLQDLEDGTITFYNQGDFTDLCRGPHLPHTGFIKAIKLTSIAGAYWRGNEKNKQLTRLYGISFPTQKELDDYLALVEEARKRDHRKIGKELSIYTMDDEVGGGLPLWLPNGTIIIEELEKLAKETEEAADYKRVVTPHIAKESLYLKSGHLPYYAESMYPPMEMDGEKYYLKAMNCPHHHKIFAAEPKSYRDLPLRLAEYGTCYRYEQSGELFGLMRVRCLHMNDAHIYCTKAQFEAEFKGVNDMYLKYFKIFGIDKYVMRFSTHEPSKRGQKYMDEPELWEQTENMVRDVLIKSGTPYIEVNDEAAFYGPKIDVQIYSAIGREFTLATNQVDFAQGKRFNLEYTTSDNSTDTPLIIHRAPLGTHERFIGFLIEHYAGNFPVWIAPQQVAVLPISDKYIDYAKEVQATLRKAGIRSKLDETSEKIGKKIRDAEMLKIPYMFVIGEKELQAQSVAVRRKGKGDMGIHTLDSMVQNIKNEILDRS